MQVASLTLSTASFPLLIPFIFSTLLVRSFCLFLLSLLHRSFLLSTSPLLPIFLISFPKFISSPSSIPPPPHHACSNSIFFLNSYLSLQLHGLPFWFTFIFPLFLPLLFHLSPSTPLPSLHFPHFPSFHYFPFILSFSFI